MTDFQFHTYLLTNAPDKGHDAEKRIIIFGTALPRQKYHKPSLARPRADQARRITHRRVR
jgi:hypothetical protein